MRRYIAVIFMIIFSFQVLPLRVLGKMLAKGQTQEEEVKSDCNDDDVNLNAAKYLDFLSAPEQTVTVYQPATIKCGFIMPQSDGIPLSYVTEILSPPPNC